MNESSIAAGTSIARGMVTSAGEGTVVLAKPQTDYALELVVENGAALDVGSFARGEIRVRAAHMHRIKSGGRYIEPVAGPPRRVSGRVLEVDFHANVLVIDAGPFPVVCTPNGLQKATDFAPDQMVTMGVKPGATFVAV